ncbi:uncharacterized protein LOC129717458 [Wyeomyia smithii]|uniref:uncharacterized protein LOC129717458 n=1 Tax=Wyeomyia smithii TaxID=174621 RepID=UPI00246803E4|nr:uncharacterized protein LOC129717458 [Wyeomyia smithii]
MVVIEEVQCNSERCEVFGEVEINTTADLLSSKMTISEGELCEDVEENPENESLSETKDDEPSIVTVPNVAKPSRLEEECGASIQCLDLMGIFRDHNSGEYIKKKYPTKKRIDQLAFSARLCHADLDVKLHNEGCLMTADDNFVAKVRIDHPQLIAQAADFLEAKRNMLLKLRILKVLQDDLATERERCQTSVVRTIQKVLQQTLEHGNSSENIQLCQFISTHCDSLDFIQFCEAITSTELISTELRTAAASFLEAESRRTARDKSLALFGHHHAVTPSAELIVELRSIMDENITAYRKQLLEMTPICLKEFFDNCSNDRIIHVHRKDVALFFEITRDLDEKLFQKPLNDLAVRWIDSVEKLTKLDPVKELLNTNFYLLAKSLQELIIEISDITDHKPEDILTSDSVGWHSIEKITWKSENSFTKCLEREYFFIIKLLKHFDLNYDSDKQSFEYAVELFEERKHHLTWSQLVRSLKPISDNEREKISDEKYIWYCLLSDVLFHTLPEKFEIECFEAIFEGYVDFMIKAGPDQMEMLRVITHSTVRFMVKTMTFLEQKDCFTIDHQILQKQLHFINAKSVQPTLTPSSFQSLVNEFNGYWKLREDILSEFPSKICFPEMESLKKTVLETVSLAFDKTSATEVLASFLKSFCELLVDLNKVQFDLYIKAFPGVSMTMLEDLKLIEVINNKWAKTEHKSYRVVEREKFTKTVSLLLESVPHPKHYVIEVLLTMLSYVRTQLTKVQWKSGDKLSETEQICTAKELLDVVKKSCLNFKSQPDYKSFDFFLDERIKPLANAVDNSNSHEEFTNQLEGTRNPYLRFIRVQHEMDIDQTLELFDELNDEVELEILRSAYQIYDETFHQLIEDSHNVSEYTSEASRIANKVLEMKFEKSFKTWTQDEKREEIPKLLAGLAVVWSILESKDVSTTGKFLTPHCTQIVCILRLLSVDQPTEGVLNHLAQVLSGQGKSLVLALTAALLALTGHEPRIACENEFLVLRNEQNFQQFYALFNVEDYIVYGTVQTIADDVIDRTEIGKLFTQLLVGANQQEQKTSFFYDMRNFVLLIDDLHWFNQPSHDVEVVAMLPGLDLIQEKIWEFVSLRKCNGKVENMVNAVYSYIGSKRMKKGKAFQDFIENDQQFRLMVHDDEVQVKRYNIDQLFEEHLRKMIQCAIEVFRYPEEEDFKLSPEGTILRRYFHKKYASENYSSYYNVFNYLRLCKSGRTTKEDNEINYGYFLLPCGSLSRTKLLRRYSLILGVSSTLSASTSSIANLLNINQTSIMPTHLGVSNLRFDQSRDFRMLVDGPRWMTAIFKRVKAVLAENRSVLICFDGETELMAFHNEYFGRLRNMNVLTEDTTLGLRNRYIEEAGIAGTITLTTSGVVRGIDFKSSDVIENYGGLHVIQTFFSHDPVEEAVIKGITARIDNNGSYELIVCRNHLFLCFLTGVESYASLDAVRQGLALKEQENFSSRLSEAQLKHQTAMKYLNAL